jgi:hypothetical protein
MKLIIATRRMVWTFVLIGGACLAYPVTLTAQGAQDPAQHPPVQDQGGQSEDEAESSQTQVPAESSEGLAENKPVEDKPLPPIAIKVAKGAIEFAANGTWKQVTPKSGMIEAEISIPKLDQDKEDGRLTIMGAGGSIEANITRWQGQFAKEDGELPEVKKESKTIADQEVHLVDISGTYLDMPGGPFAGGKTIEREGYRMLAAIIKTETNGNYFVKLYGPQHTIEQNKEHFKSMIESLKIHPAKSDGDVHKH